jgi:hypothetical protein
VTTAAGPPTGETIPLPIDVPVHGSARAHEFVTGQVGSFADAVARLRSSIAAGADVVVTTLVTRSTFRELAAMPAWLRAESVTRWRLTMARAEGRFAADPRPWIPRLGMAVPHALAAIDQARRVGIAATIRGVPRCLLGPYAGWREAAVSPGVFAAACRGCGVRDDCDGVGEWYLQTFGAKELRPLAPPPAPDG